MSERLNETPIDEHAEAQLRIETLFASANAFEVGDKMLPDIEVGEIDFSDTFPEAVTPQIYAAINNLDKVSVEYGPELKKFIEETGGLMADTASDGFDQEKSPKVQKLALTDMLGTHVSAVGTNESFDMIPEATENLSDRDAVNDPNYFRRGKAALVAGMSALAVFAAIQPEPAYAGDNRHGLSEFLQLQKTAGREQILQNALAVVVQAGANRVARQIDPQAQQQQPVGAQVDSRGSLPNLGTQYPTSVQGIYSGMPQSQVGVGGYESTQHIQLESQLQQQVTQFQNLKIQEQKNYDEAMQIYDVLQTQPRNTSLQVQYLQKKSAHEQTIIQEKLLLNQIRETQAKIGHTP